jgi:hypothetical protein
VATRLRLDSRIEANVVGSTTISSAGSVAERFKAPVLKTGDGASHP